VRDVIERLEQRGVRYFVTGSEAGGAYGVLRQTFDTDIVIDLRPADYQSIERAFGPSYAIAELIEYPGFAMGSAIEIATSEKADLIMCLPSPWTDAAMDRRVQRQLPHLGVVWVASLEDLVLAKLLWSEGTSELQLRDCTQLLRFNASAVDTAYLDRWAAALDVTSLLERVRRAT
jgi:hypothetical protein